MKTLQILLIVAVLGAASFAAWYLLGHEPGEHSGAHGHGHDDHGAGEPEEAKGPNGGRLLGDGHFSLEVVILERGVPPEFRLYAYEDGKPLPLEQVDATIELTRLGGQVDRFVFEPKGDYLGAAGIVTEPHSFDVRVAASHGSHSHQWEYESHEGRTTIPDDVAERSGIVTTVAGPLDIAELLETDGFITTDPKRVVGAAPRFTGMVKRLLVEPGQEVEAGDVLAEVENQQTGVNFEVTAPISGEVLEINLRPGELADGSSNIRIADLSTVWAQLRIYGEDREAVEAGQRVVISNRDGSVQANGTITYLSPVVSPQNQAQLARVVLDNRSGEWLPGAFINGSIELSNEEVPLAVYKSGLQTFRDFTVVFAKVDDTYEVRMLELGREDDDAIEVLGGLEPGEVYVTENSFLLKADVLKDGAAHDH